MLEYRSKIIATRIKIEHIDTIKDSITKAIGRALSLKNCNYADIRFGINETKYASAEDGKSKCMGEDVSISFGARVLAGEISSWGYFGQSLGEAEAGQKSIYKKLELLSL